ncbi:tRNA (adenosine(37)-N6)-threonylcarbamoyltransferase complex dimerization subunit type 1 TsaB [Desulfogranum japonicum]|uniref:tRNA (adenosine(37)-N6)-threonylcarbamoyltransferase complex dimerization subunit type 1 TsaB n=1 Tax=Desulfogranum japonicum TaxID=231447 RepID=UPI0003FB942C|nr:tRNA (adenosine(37)-N6)-threonylcarbamoyltransferase complex dimerization subunit type 1 TsaB [Desulfogranum japonicum]
MDGLLILSIETSTGCGSVALTRGNLQDGTVVAEYTHRPNITHSRRLLGLVDHIMTIAEVGWQDIDAVSVSLGPGSFTGLRIGLAAGKGLAMAAGRPLTGVLTLETLAWQCWGAERPVCSLLDARKGQVYAARYRFVDGNLTPQGDTLALGPEELADLIDTPTLFVGPGILAYPEIFQNHPYIDCVPQGLVHPRASMVGFLGAKQIAENRISTPGSLVPCYVRASEAQVNREKKQHSAKGQ